MKKIVQVTDPEVVGMGEPSDDRMDDSTPFGAHKSTDEEIVDHDLGLEAGLAGKPNDDRKSAAWQRGWADAQE
jgi:hypothetical protein